VARTNQSNQPGTLAPKGSLLNDDAWPHPKLFGFGAIESDCRQYARGLSQSHAIDNRDNLSNTRSSRQHDPQCNGSIAQGKEQPAGFDL
jgi:hypothetical protein